MNKIDSPEQTADGKLVMKRPTVQFEEEDARPWLKRTFGGLSPGGVRGNIFLLIVATMGSSFFYLPYCAKQIGLFTCFGMVVLCAVVSYFSSLVLYSGFKYTGAKTYDECIEGFFGRAAGVFANSVIFIHVFLGVIAGWIFSYKYLINPLRIIFKFQEGDQTDFIAMVTYFSVSFVLLFFVTYARSIDKLKTISLLGVFFILYLVVCFVGLTPTYYDYYESLGKIKVYGYIHSWYIFKAYGICQALFLNQYTILPICNAVQNVSFKRVNKITGRSIFFLSSLYIILLLAGYFSIPDDTKIDLLLLRDAINDDPDRYVLVGKIGFGLALLIAIMVKGCYLLLYAEQLVIKMKLLWNRNNNNTTEIALDTESPIDKIVQEPEAPESTGKALLKHLIFMGVLLAITVGLMKQLSTIISLIGSLIGAIEIIVLPCELIRHDVPEDQQV